MVLAVVLSSTAEIHFHFWFNDTGVSAINVEEALLRSNCPLVSNHVGLLRVLISFEYMAK